MKEPLFPVSCSKFHCCRMLFPPGSPSTAQPWPRNTLKGQEDISVCNAYMFLYFRAPKISKVKGGKMPNKSIKMMY